jgi:hypothetical protein
VELNPAAEKAFCDAALRAMIAQPDRRVFVDAALWEELSRSGVHSPYGKAKVARERHLKCNFEILSSDPESRFVVTRQSPTTVHIELRSATHEATH